MQIHACPQCKGEGKVNVTFEEYGKPETKKQIKLDCVACAGTGQVTTAILKQIEKEKKMWCKCEDRDPHAVTYHKDNEKGALVRKHHWTCNECNKIVQIG
jgi:hypothetical protein